MRVVVREPDGFTVIEPPGQVAWAAVEDAEPSPTGFQANLVVTLEHLGAGLTEAGAAALCDAALEAQERALVAHRLIDRCPERVCGRDGVRTLSHHLVGGTPVVLEQWRATAGTVGVTLSASCATLDWPAVAHALREAASTLEVDG